MVTADVNRTADRLAGAVMDDPVALVGGMVSLGAGLLASEWAVDWAVNNFAPSNLPVPSQFVDAGAATLLGVALVAGGNAVGGMAEGYLAAFALGAFAWGGMRAVQGARQMVEGGSSAAPRHSLSSGNASNGVQRSLPSPTPSPVSRSTRRASAGGKTYR